MKQIEYGVLWRIVFRRLHLRLNVCHLALVAFAASGCAAMQDESLIITAEQFDMVAAAGPDDEPLHRGGIERGAPTIIIEYPDPNTDVTSPISVKIRFVSSDDAMIDLDTLKIKYGVLNLTQKVLKGMIVTAFGIEGRIDAAKPGKYKLKFSISDDRQRTGRMTMTFRVVD